MRKFLAVLLAVFMLTACIAVLPVAAADEPADYEKSTKDGTTVADAEAIDLVVTEFMSNTINTYTSGSASSSADAFQYIEVYNRGTTDINLYNLAVVRGSNRTSGDTWNKNHMFDAKLPIQAGSIYPEKATNKSNSCVNPNSAMLKPGEFAIIWFWNDSSNSVSNANAKSLGASYTDPATGKTVFHQGFRDHYRRQQQTGETPISDDLLIVAVYAGSSSDTTNAPTFSLNTSGTYMYALVKNEAGNAFDYKTEKAYEKYYNKVDKTTSYSAFNEKIVCMWQWGTNTALSIPTKTDYFEGKSSVYVPANCTPDYYNATRTAIDSEHEAKHNFYETGYVDGFKEVGLVAFEEAPTIGAMDAWQWAYVDPDRAPEEAKALAKDGKTWQEVAIAAYNEANVFVSDEEYVENEEVNKNQGDISVDRENLGNKDQNVLEGDWEYYTEGGKYYRYPADGDKSQAEEITESEYKTGLAQSDDGLGIWLWVIIGGAAAVVLAGVAVVLIIVLKKKKPVAADDVATEGEVEIIDEQQNNAQE